MLNIQILAMQQGLLTRGLLYKTSTINDDDDNDDNNNNC